MHVGLLPHVPQCARTMPCWLQVLSKLQSGNLSCWHISGHESSNKLQELVSLTCSLGTRRIVSKLLASNLYSILSYASPSNQYQNTAGQSDRKTCSTGTSFVSAFGFSFHISVLQSHILFLSHLLFTFGIRLLSEVRFKSGHVPCWVSLRRQLCHCCLQPRQLSRSNRAGSLQNLVRKQRF